MPAATRDLTVIHDISKAKDVERELRRMQKFLDAIIEHVPAPILVKDVANQMAMSPIAVIPWSIGRSRSCSVIPRAQMVGKTVKELYPKERADFIIGENNEALRSPNPITLVRS